VRLNITPELLAGSSIARQRIRAWRVDSFPSFLFVINSNSSRQKQSFCLCSSPW